ncbi:MAG: beta-lactamase family protein [Kineosporiaceae bacterium]|nr:beta-lactamase family protein [Kineosporiaceae bacterium]
MVDIDLDLVEHLVDEHVAAGAQPGLAYGVVDGLRLVHTGGRGVRRVSPGDTAAPDADTLFRIASMTKSFTAATVLRLRDEGLLRLDDEVAGWVPQLAGVLPTADSAPLTVRAVLTMTAGWPTDDPWGDRQQSLPDNEFAALLAGGLSSAWAPGTVAEYSNLGYAVLGRVIAAAAGEPYPDAVRRRLLSPLGMASTGFTEDVVDAGRRALGHRLTGTLWESVPFDALGAFAPMGGLFSTVRDLARWVGFLADAFPARDGPDDPILRRASRRELQLPQAMWAPIQAWPTLAEPPVVRGFGYGLGLMVERDLRRGTFVQHSGGYPGFGSHMRWHPATGLGVVVLANSTYAPAGRLGSRLLDAVLDSALDSGLGRGLDAGPHAGLGTRPAPLVRTGRLEPAPSMRPETTDAREAVTRLITRWDDDLAGQWLAMNVDLDEPLERRRTQWADAVARIGPLAPDPEPSPDPGVDPTTIPNSPAHDSWWLRGPGGRIRVEIQLTPEVPPRVQTLTVTPVPDPSEQLLAVATEFCRASASPAPTWPAGLPISPGIAEDAVRQLTVAAAWSGPCRLGPAVAGDGATTATFLLDGRHRLLLALAVADGEVVELTVTPGWAPVRLGR